MAWIAVVPPSPRHPYEGYQVRFQDGKRQVDNFDVASGHFEVALEQRVREARERERTLADFVLDRASLRRDQAMELLEQSPLARWKDLEQFSAACLAYFGGTLKDHAEGGKVMSPSPRLLTRLHLRQGTVRGTFDPGLARDREELSFFAFGHALVGRLVDLPNQCWPGDHRRQASGRRPPGPMGGGLLRDPQ